MTSSGTGASAAGAEEVFCEPENFAKNMAKATAALSEFEQKRPATRAPLASEAPAKLSLLDDATAEDSTQKIIYMNIGLQKIPERVSLKPHILTLPHPWKSAADAASPLRVCVITKDPHEEWKTKVRSAQIPVITKIMGADKLYKNFKPYEAKRKLCASYDIFLADCRVLGLLPKLLGKKFFDAKKTPVAVDLTAADLRGELVNAINNTYLHLTSGPLLSIKIGTTGQPREQVVANARAVAKQVVERVAAQTGQPATMSCIKNIYAKTTGSPSLPVYTVPLSGEGAK